MSILRYIRPYQLLSFKKKVTFRQLFPVLVPMTHMYLSPCKKGICKIHQYGRFVVEVGVNLGNS